MFLSHAAPCCSVFFGVDDAAINLLIQVLQVIVHFESSGCLFEFPLPSKEALGIRSEHVLLLGCRKGVSSKNKGYHVLGVQEDVDARVLDAKETVCENSIA